MTNTRKTESRPKPNRTFYIPDDELMHKAQRIAGIRSESLSEAVTILLQGYVAEHAKLLSMVERATKEA